jgi:hypothetical protein
MSELRKLLLLQRLPNQYVWNAGIKYDGNSSIKPDENIKGEVLPDRNRLQEKFAARLEYLGESASVWKKRLDDVVGGSNRKDESLPA